MARRPDLLRRVRIRVALAAGIALAPPAAIALELGDGRVELHGYYELQLRAIARDFDASDDWDLTQFAHVLDLEVEADILPQPVGFFAQPVGIFDAATLFARVEVRYDCVWSHGCGLFPSANAFGNGAKKLPKRLNSGRRDGLVGNVRTGDRRHYRGEPLETFGLPFRLRPDDSRAPYGIDRTEAFNIVFASPGPDQRLGTADDPSPFFFDRYFGGGRCKFSSRETRGFSDGEGILNLGPIDPDCEVEPIAAFADNHLAVRKQVARGRTETGVDALGDRERVEEVARMLGGETITPTARLHAQEMLKQSLRR